MKFLTALIAFCVGIGQLGGRPIRVVGFDLLGQRFSDDLAAFAKSTEETISSDLAGSRIGLRQLQEGDADLGLLMLEPGKKPPQDDFVSVEVAYQTVVMVVPEKLPLSHLTFDQLAVIFGAKAQSTVSRWGDLAVSGPWAGRTIQAVMIDRTAGLARDYFCHEVLADGNLGPTVKQVSNSKAAYERLGLEDGGLAVLPLPPDERQGFKTVPIARHDGETAFDPSADNVAHGDYPFRLPLYIVFRRAQARELNLLLRYLLSEDATPVWKDANLLPAPIGMRNQQIFDLELL